MSTNYDQIAREYQASKLQPWRTHIERHTLLRLTGKVAGLRALDLACGEGRNAIWLALGGWEVRGIDFSDVAVARGRERAAADRV